jgi:hypothetical protein
MMVPHVFIPKRGGRRFADLYEDTLAAGPELISHSGLYECDGDKVESWSTPMQDDFALDQMQSTYRAAVEEWIAAIRAEEELASVNHSIADVDVWEGAHFREEELRTKVKAAKKQYEDALRKRFFGF